MIRILSFAILVFFFNFGNALAHRGQIFPTDEFYKHQDKLSFQIAKYIEIFAANLLKQENTYIEVAPAIKMSYQAGNQSFNVSKNRLKDFEEVFHIIMNKPELKDKDRVRQLFLKTSSQALFEYKKPTHNYETFLNDYWAYVERELVTDQTFKMLFAVKKSTEIFVNHELLNLTVVSKNDYSSTLVVSNLISALSVIFDYFETNKDGIGKARLDFVLNLLGHISNYRQGTDLISSDIFLQKVNYFVRPFTDPSHGALPYLKKYLDIKNCEGQLDRTLKDIIDQ